MRSLIVRPSGVMTAVKAATSTLVVVAVVFGIYPMAASGFRSDVLTGRRFAHGSISNLRTQPSVSVTALNSYLSTLTQPPPPPDDGEELTKDFKNKPTQSFIASSSGSYLSNLAANAGATGTSSANAASNVGASSWNTNKPNDAMAQSNGQHTPLTSSSSSPSSLSSQPHIVTTSHSYLDALKPSQSSSVSPWDISRRQQQASTSATASLNRPAPWSPQRGNPQTQQPQQTWAAPSAPIAPPPSTPSWMASPPPPVPPAPLPQTFVATASSPWTSSSSSSSAAKGNRPAPWSPKRNEDSTASNVPPAMSSGGAVAMAGMNYFAPPPPAPQPPAAAWSGGDTTTAYTAHSATPSSPPSPQMFNALPTNQPKMARKTPWSPPRDGSAGSGSSTAAPSPPSASWTSSWNTASTASQPSSVVTPPFPPTPYPASASDASTLSSPSGSAAAAGSGQMFNAIPSKPQMSRKAPWSPPRKGSEGTGRADGTAAATPPAPVPWTSSWSTTSTTNPTIQQPSSGAQPPAPSTASWNTASGSRLSAATSAPPSPVQADPATPSTGAMYNAFPAKPQMTRKAPWSPPGKEKSSNTSAGAETAAPPPATSLPWSSSPNTAPEPAVQPPAPWTPSWNTAPESTAPPPAPWSSSWNAATSSSSPPASDPSPTAPMFNALPAKPQMTRKAPWSPLRKDDGGSSTPADSSDKAPSPPSPPPASWTPSWSTAPTSPAVAPPAPWTPSWNTASQAPASVPSPPAPWTPSWSTASSPAPPAPWTPSWNTVTPSSPADPANAGPVFNGLPTKPQMTRKAPWSPPRKEREGTSAPVNNAAPSPPPAPWTSSWNTAPASVPPPPSPWTSSWNTADPVNPSPTGLQPPADSDPTPATPMFNALPTKPQMTRKAPWSPPRKGDSTSGAIPDTPASPPAPPIPQSTWTSSWNTADTINPSSTATPPASPPVPSAYPSYPTTSSTNVGGTTGGSSRPAPWSPLDTKSDGRPAPWSPDKGAAERPAPWSPRKDDSGGAPQSASPWTNQFSPSSDSDLESPQYDSDDDKYPAEPEPPQPPYMIWQGMLDSTRTNDTNLIGDITETEGIVIRAPEAPVPPQEHQAYSYLDNMEDLEEDEKTEAELLAEKIQAAAVDVEITDKIIAEKEEHLEFDDENMYVDERMELRDPTFDDPMQSPDNMYFPGSGPDEGSDFDGTFSEFDQTPPPQPTRPTRRRSNVVRWDSQPLQGTNRIPIDEPPRQDIPATPRSRDRSEVRRVKYSSRFKKEEEPVITPQPTPTVASTLKQPPVPAANPKARRDAEQPVPHREPPPMAQTSDSMSNYVDETYEARDKFYMEAALELAASPEAQTSFPNPNIGAVLVAEDDTVLAQSHSDFETDAMRSLLQNSGLQIGKEGMLSWPVGSDLSRLLASSTLYLSMEPTSSQTLSLIGQAGIARVVIGALDPVLENQGRGATALQASGILVSFVPELEEVCQAVIQDYAESANSKFPRMARKHSEIFGRPLGLLHCSVIDSDIVRAFIEQSAGAQPKDPAAPVVRSHSSFELAPPPDALWVGKLNPDEESEQRLAMPWYEQTDAVVATFPRPGNGPPDDDSIAGRLFALRWLATHGSSLPPSVERILVLDATDLKDLPLVNGDPNLLTDIDIESFWEGKNRKPTRIILRQGDDRMAQELAKAAASAAVKAAEAAKLAAAAIRPGDAARAAEIAIECQKSAQASADYVLKELNAATEMRRKLESFGVVVESIEGGEPVDIMKHLGEQYGLNSVVWRAGCWGERGLRIMRSGAFQMVSAHLIVPSEGSKFWQLMKAENSVQAACGPRSKVQVFSDQEDLSMEYCDEGDEECILMLNGDPVRQVRLDCRVALLEDERSRDFMLAKTHRLIDPNLIPSEDAQWLQ